MNQIKNISEYLLNFHIKPSMQRLAIMEYLLAHRIHPTAEDVYHALYQKIPTLSKTTVYNTLNLFVAQGALQVMAIDGKNVRFDIDTTLHAHFKCQHCQQVYDLPVENIHMLKLADNSVVGQVTEMQLYYRGYCKNCLQGHKVN
ncbi:MAG: transcriptional repressor [Oscillibacter sp.]|nr:transcriptional repressor [Oscillibacter sp.]